MTHTIDLGTVVLRDGVDLGTVILRDGVDLGTVMLAGFASAAAPVYSLDFSDADMSMYLALA